MADPYTGLPMLECLGSLLDWENTYAVIVTGAALNPCGHAILNVGGVGGYYFHIALRKGLPHYMREAGYRQYLIDEDKRELRRHPVDIRNPKGAQQKLEELLSRTWRWWVLPHNCEAFVEEVVRAGGSRSSTYTNCPRLEEFR